MKMMDEGEEDDPVHLCYARSSLVIFQIKERDQSGLSMKYTLDVYFVSGLYIGIVYACTVTRLVFAFHRNNGLRYVDIYGMGTAGGGALD